MKAIPSTLKIYWEDGVTIENRYFPSKSAAKEYAIKNGCTNYEIVNRY